MVHLRLLLAVALVAVTAPASAEPRQVTLLHVNDTHSHLDAWGPKDANLDGTLGGLGKAASIIAAEKAVDPTTLFIHAGDFMHGDPLFNEFLGIPELILLQSLGLDVLVPGNHELQYTPDVLALELLGAQVPVGGGVSIVGTNLDLTNFPPLSLWIQKTAIRDANGVKVGFFGLTLKELNEELESPDGGGVDIDVDYAAVAGAAVTQLRSEGAQVVICVAHIGLDASRDLAAAVPGIDVIVQGHDHVALPQPEAIARPSGGTTLLVSAGSFYRWVGRLRLAVDGGAVSLVDYTLLGVDESTPSLPPVQAKIDALKVGVVARYGDIYHVPIAWADQGIPNSTNLDRAKRDTAIGDLFTDAYRAFTGTDIAIELGGFLDEGLPAGAIVAADLFRSMSYGIPEPDATRGLIVAPFRLATFAIRGSELLGLLNFAVKMGGDITPQVSGLRFDYDSSRPIEQDWIDPDSVHIGGAKLDGGRWYTVTANEGLLIGLGKLSDLGLLPVDIQDLIQDVNVLSERAKDAAVAFVVQRGTLGPGTSGRIRDVAAIPGTERARRAHDRLLPGDHPRGWLR